MFNIFVYTCACVPQQLYKCPKYKVTHVARCIRLLEETFLNVIVYNQCIPIQNMTAELT